MSYDRHMHLLWAASVCTGQVCGVVLGVYQRLRGGDERMSDDHESEAERRNATRDTVISNAKSELRDKRSFARSVNTQLKSHGTSDPGNVRPFLAGVQVGLQMGEFAIEDHIDTNMIYEPEEDE